MIVKARHAHSEFAGCVFDLQRLTDILAELFNYSLKCGACRLQ